MAGGRVKTANWLIFLWAKKPHKKDNWNIENRPITINFTLFDIPLKIFKLNWLASFAFPIIALIFAIRLKKALWQITNPQRKE